MMRGDAPQHPADRARDVHSRPLARVVPAGPGQGGDVGRNLAFPRPPLERQRRHLFVRMAQQVGQMLEPPRVAKATDEALKLDGPVLAFAADDLTVRSGGYFNVRAQRRILSENWRN
jgi:hypothetical protein